MKSCGFGNRAHILKHSHGRMVFGPFEKVFHEGTLWSGYRAVIYFVLTKQIFLHFFYHGNRFYNRYLNSVDKKKIDDNGSGEKPKFSIQIRMIKYSFCDPLHAIFDRDKKWHNRILVKKISNWVYFYTWVWIP